jgi:hypothetical protein
MTADQSVKLGFEFQAPSEIAYGFLQAIDG